MYSSILMSNSSRHVLINHLSSALEYFDATLHVPINFTNLLFRTKESLYVTSNLESLSYDYRATPLHPENARPACISAISLAISRKKA